MSATLYAFPECEEAAAALARRLDLPLVTIQLHHFPDRESLVRAWPSSSVALVYRSLDHPNEKLLEVLLAASALRDGGAERLVLVAPYLGYMRQDKAFHPGEAVSQRVIGGLLAKTFDGVLTVDPHLHRVRALSEVVPNIPAVAITAASAIAEGLRADVTPATILVGPDSESAQWVGGIAGLLGLRMLVGEKSRRGDRDIDLSLPGAEGVRGQPVVLVDDVISSGATLARCTRILREAGAARVDIVATHCLASADDLQMLRAAGADSIRSTTTVPQGTAAFPIAECLAQGLLESPIRELWSGPSSWPGLQ